MLHGDITRDSLGFVEQPEHFGNVGAARDKVCQPKRHAAQEARAVLGDWQRCHDGDVNAQVRDLVLQVLKLKLEALLWMNECARR